MPVNNDTSASMGLLFAFDAVKPQLQCVNDRLNSVSFLSYLSPAVMLFLLGALLLFCKDLNV